MTSPPRGSMMRTRSDTGESMTAEEYAARQAANGYQTQTQAVPFAGTLNEPVPQPGSMAASPQYQNLMIESINRPVGGDVQAPPKALSSNFRRDAVQGSLMEDNFGGFSGGYGRGYPASPGKGRASFGQPLYGGGFGGYGGYQPSPYGGFQGSSMGIGSLLRPNMQGLERQRVQAMMGINPYMR